VSIKEVWVLVLAVPFSWFPGFSSVSDPRGIMAGLAGKVGRDWMEVEDNEGGI